MLRDDQQFAEAIPASESSIGQDVYQQIQEVIAAGRRPVVALDLDLTLIDNTPRTRGILADFLRTHGSEVDLAAASGRIETMPLAFSIVENLRAIGAGEQPLLGEGLHYWRERFFQDAWCSLDEPYRGAAETVRALRGLGALVVYVTARIAASQAVGTVESLRTHGFPVAEAGTVLLMKPTAHTADEHFKSQACHELRQLGDVIFAVDNEPAHCHTFADAFPGAIVALMDTRHSPSAPVPRANLRRIAHWPVFCASLEAR